MPAKKPGRKTALRTAAPSRTTVQNTASKRTVVKKSGAKKKAGEKQSSPGFFGKASHMVGAVLMGAATGAVAGAVKGAVEAGAKEAGIPAETEEKDCLPKDQAQKTEERRKRT